MNGDRWRRIEELYHAARLLNESARGSFLAAATEGDEELRHEVESLLVSGASSPGFLDEPVQTGGVAALVSDAESLSGRRIGTYSVHERIGAGGMGEVYLAHDSKLRRDVAFKVLAAGLLGEHDQQRQDHLRRFRHEAHALAALNHPNIAAIYGLEEADGVTAIVMELVDGSTLADRIMQGAVPVLEALPVATQIAEALEAAHERGIVHRDLKPANIKLRPDGTVKVLDFGLAKAVGPAASVPDVSQRATNTAPPVTATGVIVGTAAYMSPEQAAGKTVDHRADIWAFGCVLFEMLTGRAAFGGDTLTDTLAAVMRAEPEWSRLPSGVTAPLRELIRRCLRKDPRQRLQAIGDARIVLDEVLAGTSPDADTVGVTSLPARRIGRPALILALAMLTIGIVATWKLKPSPEPSRPVVRFTIDLPSGQHFATAGRSALALSADGSLLAYVATRQADGAQQIYLRAMASGEIRPVPGTEGAANPFFSPDGQWLGFFAGGKLKKVLAGGGVAQPLADALLPGGASWGSRGTIVFSPEAGGNLYEVPEQGGAVRPLTEVDAADGGFFAPQFLPEDKSVLFARFKPSPAILDQPIGAAAPRVLIEGPTLTGPRYVASGHLIYVQAGNLMAVSFDAERSEVRGSAVPVVSSVLQSPQIVSPAEYSVSDTGTLAYVPGAAPSPRGELVWVDRSGVETPLRAPERNYHQPRISPDGKRIAVEVNANASVELWFYDLSPDALSRLPLEGSMNGAPVWTPDGKRIAYMSNREGPGRTFWQLADGSGAPERLTSGDIQLPFSWSSDGQILATVDASKNPAIWLLHIADRKVERFPPDASTLNDAPQFSPDGHWIAYVSWERGQPEIYIQPYPGPGGKHQIPSNGGTEPLWNPNGREIFYRVGDKMMAVDVTTQPSFFLGKPHELFERHYLANTDGYARPNYDVSPDGRRFLMVKPVEGRTGSTQIDVVLNWTEELKRLVAIGKR